MLAPGQCRLLKFGTGNTLFIPSGWIHAVFTPKDTLVFGGNFLHSMGAAMQLRVHDIEMATKVPQKYLFPRYKLLYRFFISQMLSRLREELFGWKDLAGIEGYHTIFGTGYSHDKDTLLTRLRGAELSAREGPRIGEDMEKFIFLRKCLWRQQMRLRRLQRKEAEAQEAKRAAREAHVGDHCAADGAVAGNNIDGLNQGSDNIEHTYGREVKKEGDSAIKVVNNSGLIDGKDAKAKVSSPAEDFRATPEAPAAIMVKQEPALDTSLSPEKENPRSVYAGSGDPNFHDVEDDPPLYEMLTVQLSFAINRGLNSLPSSTSISSGTNKRHIILDFIES